MSFGYKALWVLLVAQAGVIGFLAYSILYPSDAQLKKLHYGSETAVLVSPHSLREKIEHGSNPYVLVDVREKEHYELGHIIGAINIVPNSKMVEAFKELERANPEKEILIYCYTEVCMRGRKVGRELARQGIFVRELGIGFQEWKNSWRDWNYEWEWPEVNIEELIVVGEEPGVYEVDPEDLLRGPKGCSDGAFSC